MSEVIAIILAAGGSTRMGRCKALLPLDGAPLVVRHVEALLRTCSRVRVVVGCDAEAIRGVLSGDVDIVLNPDWATTETRHSLALALEDLADDTTIVVTPVDTPPAPAFVLDALLAAGAPAVPECDGSSGHPVVIRCESARKGLTVGTLRDVLSTAQTVSVPWTDTCVSFNTPLEWSEWCATRRSRAHP